MKKLLIGAFLLTGLVGLGVWRWAHVSDPLPVLEATPVERGDLISAVTATGSLQASRSLDIKFDGQNYIERLYVKEGDHVRKDQLLARLETQLLDHARNQAQQTVEKDAASLVQSEANFHREEALWKGQLVARVDYDSAQAAYLAALHQKSADEQMLQQTRDQIGRATLRSPMDGTVTALYVHEGEMLGSAAAVAALGASTAISKPTNTLMTIVESGPPQVWADVNAADLGNVSQGQTVDISLDAFRPRVFHGRVSSIGLQPAVVNGVTTYRTIITVRDPSPQMRIGMPVNVMLLKTLASGKLLVPSAAVTGKQVIVVQPAGRRDASVQVQLAPVAIQVLGRSGSAVAIEGKLQAGDLLLTQGRYVQKEIHCVLRTNSFPLRPSFDDYQFSGTKTPANSGATLPGPKPQSMLQRLFGV